MPACFSLSTRRGRHLPLPGRTVSLLLALAAFAAPLRAQTDGGDPIVTISPQSGTFTSPSILVSVRFFDNATLKTSTRSIVFNDTVVTTQFTHSSVGTVVGGVASTSTATLTLRAGTNTVRASICDNAATSTCSDTSVVTFTYVPGRPGVQVTPDGWMIPAVGATTQVHTFTVQNPGTSAGTYRLTAECHDGLTGAPHTPCTLSASSVSLAAGGAAAASVSTTAAAGRVLLVRMSAELESIPGVADAGWVDVMVAGNAGTAKPVMEAQSVDLATGVYAVQRGQCVTASAGPGAAYECGDLRLAHALPAHRTLNRVWAPVLMYNSQHADPRPSVYLDATLPAGTEVPSQVSAALYFSGSGLVEQRFFAGSEWQPGTTRRIAVQVDAMNTAATGWYQYDAQVLASSSYGQSSSPVIYTGLTMVNRAGSPFGRGWWLAGLEQLVPVSSDRMLWVGGDGSNRMYRWVTPGVWVWSNPGGPPDSLTTTSTAYIRKLPEGGRVEFDGTGTHQRTVNRLGQVTTFVWQSGRLARVEVPTPSGTAPAYEFTYTNGILTSVAATAPGAPTRTVTLVHALGDGRVTSIVDPDGVGVQFAYGHSRPNLVTRRTDRRGTPLTFTWTATGRLSTARLGVATGDSIISVFEAVEDKGFTTSVPLALTYTALEGPRTDVSDRTLLWLDGRGAPRRVRDPLGGETVLTRGDSRFPALVTEVRTPNARGDSLVLRTSVVYDARGRMDTTRVHNPLGDGVNLVTTYGWNNAVDRPAWIQSPGAAIVRMGYDSVTRNPTWQEQGDSTRRVRFDYNADGQVIRIRYPHPTNGTAGGGGRDSLAYDARGNLKRTVSPLGFVTLMYRDALGRVTETISPVHAGSSSDSASVANTGLRSTVAYDVMDRDTMSVTYGRAMTLTRHSTVARLSSTDAEAATVRTTYDAGGLPLTVERWSTPDTAHVDRLTTTYAYDAAGRRTSESDGMVAEYYAYNPAGNLVVHTTRRSHQITMSYDALGRMTRRVTPAVTYPATSVDCSDPFNARYPTAPRWTPCVFSFPKFPNNTSGGWTIPADTAYFSFDAAGGMTVAQNGDAIVSRSYYPGGALRTDSLRIRAYGAGSFSQHAYGLEYRYDAAGRARALLHPYNLAGAAQRDSFAYEPVTGALQTVVGRTNLSFGYGYDLLGRLTSETMPTTSGTLGNTYTYDLDGRRTSRAGIYGETFTYDARGKVLSAAVTGRSTFYNYYSGLGNLVATEWDNDNNAAEEVEEFRVDALGHQVWRRSATNNQLYRDPEYVTRYSEGTSRVDEVQFTFPPPGTFLDSAAFARDTTFRTYDAAGNVTDGWERAWGNSYRKVQTRSYYGADDKLRVQQGYNETGVNFTGERRGYFSEYRYDALGR
ncbi:MAG TPA: hypothetical protein VFT45_09540, partial [Longimicrobium sp.]|nr:hypothetical protein [Longimicrobium sp.]